ncbi:MAG TPA: aldehyde dehydrogenase family protein [Mycobacterium sp.]|jgi:acyl-CoA reductase-like NAD-dependent aldehyde dehydrogenase|nr:aldehyde dehydrogenase family protein [Mycobacterium sp.]
MTLSLTDLDIALPHPDQHFIGGVWQSPTSDARVTVISPNDESIVANLPDVGSADVDKAVSAARVAFDDGPWSQLPLAERVSALRRLTSALLSRSQRIGLAWSLECGPTAAFRDAINGIVAPTVYENMFGFAESVPMSEDRTGFAGPVTIVREPYGVVVTILTYNGPLAYLGMKVLPALLSGNVVVLKLPIETRLVAQYIAEAAEEADLPAGVLSVMAAGTEASKYLVEHPGIDMVSFTGGTTVGAQILHSTADRVVRTTLELGGKSAGIIADDIETADLLPALLPGLLPFQGQVCVALTRLLVTRERHDEVVGALTGAFSSLKIGSAMDPSSDFGPVAVSRTRDRCERFVAGAVRDGATIACGGKRPAGLDRGWYYEPTLLTGVHNSMEIAQEEVFGPVFTVMTYDDIDDAVRIANDSKYGLTAAMFTNDSELARSVGRRMRVGSFTVNSTGGVLGQPFGGFKLSGIGREMGLEGYLEWSQTKSMKISAEGNYLAG